MDLAVLFRNLVHVNGLDHGVEDFAQLLEYRVGQSSVTNSNLPLGRVRQDVIDCRCDLLGQFRWMLDLPSVKGLENRQCFKNSWPRVLLACNSTPDCIFEPIELRRLANSLVYAHQELLAIFEFALPLKWHAPQEKHNSSAACQRGTVAFLVLVWQLLETID